MRSLLFISSLIIILISCGNPKDKEVNEKSILLGKNYGPETVDTSKAITVSEMVKQFETNNKEMEFTILAPIEEVCSKAGCWINIDKGNGEKFMVRFKDHFTIPTKTKLGTEAYIHGVAYWDTISVELLKHFADDAGKSQKEINKINAPKFEMGFEADGIVLKK